MLFALNYLSVFLYGLLIVVFLLDIEMNKKNLIPISIYAIASIIFQLALFSGFGKEFLEKSYPVCIHLPLAIFFCTFFRKRLNHVLFALCTAYILTTPRKWIGNFIALFFNSNENVTIIIQIVISIPLLFIIYKYMRHYVVKILAHSGVQFRLLVVIPLIYYVIAYLTTVYTDMLYSSKILVIGILSIGLSAVFYFFLVAYFNELSKQFEMQNEKNILSVQLSAFESHIRTMKQAEENTIIYRHDLRHHLNLISGHLLNKNITDAQAYINQIEESINNTATIKYCENNAVNLILSSYIHMAMEEGIEVDSYVAIRNSCGITDMDLCVIFANGIENAINACKKISDKEKRKITLSCHTKNNKVFIQIINPYEEAVEFHGDIPISKRDGHGIGIISMVNVVKKYQGVYSFVAKDNLFTLSVII